MPLHVHFPYPFLSNTFVEPCFAFIYFYLLVKAMYIKNAFQKVVLACLQQQEFAAFLVQQKTHLRIKLSRNI